MFVELIGRKLCAFFHAECREYYLGPYEGDCLHYWEAVSIVTVRENGEDCPCIVETKKKPRELFDRQSFLNEFLGDCWRLRATAVADERALIDAALAVLVRKYRKRVQLSPRLTLLIGDGQREIGLDLDYHELIASGILLERTGQRRLPLENHP